MDLDYKMGMDDLIGSFGVKHYGFMEKLHEGLRKYRQKLESIPVVLQVRDAKHARTDEVLNFCVEQLRQGKTYNELRMMLGLAPSSYVWRVIREHLLEMILPESEEEALRADAAQSRYLLQKMEDFLKKVEERAKELKGSENEHHFLKLELEAMRYVMEKYNKRTEHFLKMKDLQKREKGRVGATIIFKNNFQIARPGDEVDVTPKDLAQLQKIVDG